MQFIAQRRADPVPVHRDYNLEWDCPIRLRITESDYHGKPGNRFMVSVDKFLHGEDANDLLATLADQFEQAAKLLREVKFDPKP